MEPLATTRMSSKGQVVIPSEVRKKANLSPGDKVEVKISKEGGVIILPSKKNFTERFKGRVKCKLSLNALEKLYEEKS